MARTNNASNSNFLSAPSVIGALPVSMSCWYNGASGATSALVTLSAIGSNGSQLRLWLNLAAGGKYEAVSVTSGSTFAQATSTGTVSVGTWQHVGAVFASTTDRRVFLDGSKDTDSTSNDPDAASWDTIGIGILRGGSDLSAMNGDLAEVAMWDIALSDNDMVALASGLSPLSIRPDGLVHYWPLHGRYGKI